MSFQQVLHPVVFSTFTFKGLLGQLSESSLSKHLTCAFRTYSQLQPTNLTYFSLLISRQVVGVLILSKHLTCVSRTHSQPQPVEIFSMLISRQVVGVFTCPNTSLVSSGLTPNLSLSRYSQSLRKHVVSGNQSTSHFHQMTLQPTCQKMK